MLSTTLSGTVCLLVLPITLDGEHLIEEPAESWIEEGHLMPDHVHMLISIPEKYAVSQVVGHIEGKSAIHVARVYGEHLWR